MAERLYRKLANDSLFPNSFASRVQRNNLKNGEPILFYPDDVEASRRRRQVDVSGFKKAYTELAKHNLHLVVLLVPDKYTVYRPLLKDDESPEGPGPLYLNTVEKALREAGVPVINLVDVFRERARQDYDKHQYLYWRDDVHWNPRGVELAAEEIAKRRSLAPAVNIDSSVASRAGNGG
jgi:hypothetical protein